MSTAKSHHSKSEQGRAGGPSSTQRAAAPATLENALEGILMGTPSDHMTPAERVALIQEVADAKRTLEQPRELPPEQQAWYRKPDSPLRKQAEKIVVMRAAGRKDADIAKRMDTTAKNVQHVIYIARKNGWLDADDEPVDLEAELAINIERKVVRNISAALDGQMTNWQTHEMTIAAAKGRGIFTDQSKVDVTQNQTSLVQIQILRVDPQGEPLPAIAADQMGGVPAYIEGEVCGTPTSTATDPASQSALTVMPKSPVMLTPGPSAGS